MKLSYRDAQRLYGGLRRLDEDAETKFTPEVRVRIGININRLLPHVRLYEREIQRVQTALVNGSPRDANGEVRVDPQKQLKADNELLQLSDTVENFPLKKFTIGDLNLEENKKIKAETLAQIGYLVRNFDDGSSDDD